MDIKLKPHIYLPDSRCYIYTADQTRGEKLLYFSFDIALDSLSHSVFACCMHLTLPCLDVSFHRAIFSITLLALTAYSLWNWWGWTGFIAVFCKLFVVVLTGLLLPPDVTTSLIYIAMLVCLNIPLYGFVLLSKIFELVRRFVARLIRGRSKDSRVPFDEAPPPTPNHHGRFTASDDAANSSTGKRNPTAPTPRQFHFPKDQFRGFVPDKNTGAPPAGSTETKSTTSSSSSRSTNPVSFDDDINEID